MDKEKQIKELSFSMLRLYILLKACQQDVIFIKEYKHLILPDHLEVIKKAFPSINHLLKHIEKDFANDKYAPSVKAEAEEIPFKVMDFVEDLIR